MMPETIHCTLFDGERVTENAAVTVENGVITHIGPSDRGGNGLFLMPGLIDSHTHMGTKAHVDALLCAGVTATCDVCAPAELVAESRHLHIVSSAGMAMGVVLSGKHFVEKMADRGAKYIKVLLFGPHSIGKSALNAITAEAHRCDLKVAAHATELATVTQAVEAGVDILLHVPMKEIFPEHLAKAIAQKGIAVAPTLIMMETFCNSGRNGYKPEQYANSRAAVKLLHECGVTILGATDANPGDFAPGVAYGTSMHRELELLVEAGLTPVEALASATAKNAEAFGMETQGRILPGQRANMILMEGRPDQNIHHTANLVRIWANGDTIWEKEAL